jgi:hypothetical protein
MEAKDYGDRNVAEVTNQGWLGWPERQTLSLKKLRFGLGELSVMQY